MSKERATPVDRRLVAMQERIDELLETINWLMATRRNCDSEAGLKAEKMGFAALAKVRKPT